MGLVFVIRKASAANPCIHTYSTGDFTYPIFPYICTVLSYIARGNRWYEPVIPVAPAAIRGHITTKLHELKPALDASKGQYRRKYKASTDAPGVEIGIASAAFEGQTSMHTQGK